MLPLYLYTREGSSVMAETVRAATVQFEHADGKKRVNMGKIEAFLDDAVKQKVQIVVFPECCITGYWFLRKLSKKQLLDLAEPVPSGPSTQTLKKMAKESGVVIGAGFVEVTDSGELFNTYVVALPDGSTYRHRKLHCFISDHLGSGTEYTVFDAPFGLSVGVLICYDCNIGENVRITAMKGAQLLMAPHQTGGCTSKNPHTMGLVEHSLWENRYKSPGTIEDEFKGPKGREWLLRWLPTRAHDNGLFLLFSNGVGVDDDEIRTGNAMIIDPYGRILSETWKADDNMVIADLDLSLLQENTGQRWIRTRRPELYGMLTKSTGFEQDTRAVRFDNKGI